MLGNIDTGLPAYKIVMDINTWVIGIKYEKVKDREKTMKDREKIE